MNKNIIFEAIIGVIKLKLNSIFKKNNRLLIKNINIINEGIKTSGDIYIEGEFIKKIGVDIKFDNEMKIIDGNGRIAIPGMIDDQVHFREPGLTHKGDISSESKAAIAGGVTSYFEIPNTFQILLEKSSRKNSDCIKEFIRQFFIYVWWNK